MTSEPESALERAFEDDRRYVWGVSYRMTGSAADADDIVQETFARALAHKPDEERPLRPWLTRVAVNLARDQLRRRKRQAYDGPWLPTPLLDDELARVDLPDDAPSAEARYDLKESATLAFLVALDELSPRQRAVLLLRDVLGWNVRETAGALDMSEGNVKTTLHRARAAMRDYDEGRASFDEEALARAEQALERFLAAVGSGDEAALLELLAEDARIYTDGGGVYAAARNVVRGARDVTTLVFGVLKKGAAVEAIDVLRVNGHGAVQTHHTPRREREAPRVLISLDVDRHGKVRNIFSVSMPEKLARVPSSL